jgi:hypothetical protein
MTRNIFCLLASLVLLLLSFLHAFGVLAWYGDQLAADPVRVATITLAYPLVAWAAVRAVRSTGGDGLFGAIVMAVSLGGMHLALQGWWSYSRGGMAIDETYSAALPMSGAVMIILSVTLLSYCLAAHAGRKRKFIDAFAVFLVAMSAFHGASMFLVQIHAEHVERAASLDRLQAELQQQIKDAKATLDEVGRIQFDVPASGDGKEGIQPSAGIPATDP